MSHVVLVLATAYCIPWCLMGDLDLDGLAYRQSDWQELILMIDRQEPTLYAIYGEEEIPCDLFRAANWSPIGDWWYQHEFGPYCIWQIEQRLSINIADYCAWQRMQPRHFYQIETETY